jgi:glycosyltransferase involved in cell wall biosynthesis
MMVTVHDVYHLAMGPMVGGIHKRLYARFMFRRLVRQAREILAVSQFTRDELVRWTGTTAEKIQVIPNGVDESWFKVKRRFRPHPKPYLLFVGNIKPNKNLVRLLDAFGKLKNRIPHDLVLVGKKEGFLTGDRMVLEKARLMEDRVHFTGNVDEVLLGQYYAFADLMVFPSLYEGFGLPALEAMACGVPVAASKAASIPEVCGKAAVYFDPLDSEDMAEKILRPTVKGPFRQGMVRKGLQQAKGFNWDKSAKKTNLVIDHLLNPKSKK